MNRGDGEQGVYLSFKLLVGVSKKQDLVILGWPVLFSSLVDGVIVRSVWDISSSVADARHRREIRKGIETDMPRHSRRPIGCC